jgi:hypothetical protein
MCGMTKLERVGFFREMAHAGPEDPSLAEARGDAAGPHQETVATYLEAGHVYIGTPAMAVDALDGVTPIGPPHYLTDGVHVWPGDAAYYVRRYNVRLPAAFVDYVVASGGGPATVDLAGLRL